MYRSFLLGVPVSSFSGVNQFDGGDDITDDDDESDVRIVQPVLSGADSIPQFDGAGDLIELDTPVKTTATPLAPGGANVLTGTVCLLVSGCSLAFFDVFWFCVCFCF